MLKGEKWGVGGKFPTFTDTDVNIDISHVPIFCVNLLALLLFTKLRNI